MPICAYKDIAKILAQIEKGKPYPVYLIAGDSYLCQEVYQHLISRLLPEKIRSFNLEVVDGEKEGISSILDRIQTFPFFPGRKVVLVKNALTILSSGSETFLWKKAEEAWMKGEAGLCSRLLLTLFQNAGISFKEIKDGLKGNTEGLAQKIFLSPGAIVPEWLNDMVLYIEEHSLEGSTPLYPDQLLESAIKKGFPEGHVLIFLVENLPVKNKIIRTLTDHGMVLDLSIKKAKKGEQTAALKGLLKTRLSQEGKSILPQAEALLLERVGPEAYLLEMEIQKLLSYTGDRKQIQPVDIAEIVGAFREEPIFELTTVLGERKLKEGLEKLKQLWEQGYHPLQILAGITNDLRRLLVAKELLETVPEAPSRAWQNFGAFSAKILPQLKQVPLPELLSKDHPFRLFNTFKTARNFSSPDLISALEALHEADRLLKTSGATPAFLLEDFILSFCKTTISS